MSNILPYAGSVQVMPFGFLGINPAAFGWMDSCGLLGSSISGQSVKLTQVHPTAEQPSDGDQPQQRTPNLTARRST